MYLLRAHLFGQGLLGSVLLLSTAARAEFPQPDPEAEPLQEPAPATENASQRAASAYASGGAEADKNLPPVIQRILPERYNRPEVDVVIGRRASLTFDVLDPEGMPLSVTLLGAPPGAEFSASLRTLTWTPTASQRGDHLVRFVASDGVREASRLVTLRVVENHPPELAHPKHVFYAGETGVVSFGPTDPNGDPLKVRGQGVPDGATLDAETGVLTWTPRESDVGERVLHITASDGELETTEEVRLRVEPRSAVFHDEEWKSFFLPGAGYSVYVPRGRDAVGALHGASLEILMGAWIHENENRGPSHGRIYVNVELLESTKADVPILFAYALGFSLSLERNPQRSWLVPAYGADIGGLSHDELGARFQSTPYLALHFYSSPNLFVTARAGYRLVPADLERLGGAHYGLTADLSVW